MVHTMMPCEGEDGLAKSAADLSQAWRAYGMC